MFFEKSQELPPVSAPVEDVSAWREALLPILHSETERFCGTPWPQTNPRFEVLLERLIYAAKFHVPKEWSTSPERAVQFLRDGSSRFKCDILSDIVHLVAAQSGDRQALTSFLKEIGPFVETLWQKNFWKLGRYSHNDKYEILPDLLGFHKPPGRLSYFKGEGCLRSYLPAAVNSCIMDLKKREAKTPDKALLTLPPLETVDFPSLEHRECHQLLQREIGKLFGQFSNRDEAILRMYFEKGLELAGKDGSLIFIANLMKVNRGTVTKWFQQIRDQILDYIHHHKNPSVGHCFKSFYKESSQALFDILQKNLPTQKEDMR